MRPQLNQRPKPAQPAKPANPAKGPQRPKPKNLAQPQQPSQAPTSTKREAVIVIMVDCSESMKGNKWRHLQPQVNRLIEAVGKERVILMTCGDYGKVVADKELRADIAHHIKDMECFAFNNFLQCFKSMEAVVVNEGAKNKPLKIVFVTDGGDELTESDLRLNLKGSKVSANHPVHFFTVGIGKDYPTEMAVRLRNYYQSGSITPELFHVSDENNESIYREMFDQLLPFLTAPDEEEVDFKNFASTLTKVEIGRKQIVPVLAARRQNARANSNRNLRPAPALQIQEQGMVQLYRKLKNFVQAYEERQAKLRASFDSIDRRRREQWND